MTNKKQDPDDIIEVPRWAATIAARFIADFHSIAHEGNGEILGILGGAWELLDKASNSEGKTSE